MPVSVDTVAIAAMAGAVLLGFPSAYVSVESLRRGRSDVRATLRGGPPARRVGCERFNPRSREPGSMIRWDWFFAVGMGAVLLLILLGLVVSFL